MGIAIWLLMSPWKPQVPNRKSIRSKLPKEPESNFTNDFMTNPALFASGVFFWIFFQSVDRFDIPYLDQGKPKKK
jgi:hypothetical protein